MGSFVAPPPPAGLRPGGVPTFAVAIAAYQAAATIGAAVESARAQTLRPAEILVCDDGSTDGLAAALAPHRDAVRLVRQEHRGVAAARNALVRAATADFVAMLDADDVLAPARLERLAALAAARPDLDILATDALLVSGGRAAGRFSEVTPFAAERQREAILERCFLVNPALRRTALLAAGGYDETLATAEDWDCYLRLILAGSAAGLVDEPLFEYRLRGASLTAARGETLLDRVRVLEKAAAGGAALSPRERRTLAASLRRHRGRALQQLAREAAAARDPSMRSRLLAVARSADVAPRARARAALAALAPAAAAARLAGALAESTGRPP